MKIPMLNPKVTQSLALGVVLVLRPWWQPAQASADEPAVPLKKVAAAQSDPEPVALKEEPLVESELLESGESTELTEFPDVAGDMEALGEQDNATRSEQPGSSSPTQQPAAGKRQQALVTFPAPLRRNTAPNSGGIFKWPASLRSNADDDPPIEPEVITKSLFSQAARHVPAPVIKPKALVPPGMFSSHEPAATTAPSSQQAEAKRSRALFSGSLSAMVEPQSSNLTASSPTLATVAGPNLASDQTQTLPAGTVAPPVPQSRTLHSVSTTVGAGQPASSNSIASALPVRMPPANDKPKALFNGSPFDQGQLNSFANGQPTTAAATGWLSAPPPQKALFSGTILAKRVAPSAAAGGTSTTTVAVPPSRALFPTLAKNQPIPASAPAGVPTLAAPAVPTPPFPRPVASRKAAVPAADEFDTERALSMMKNLNRGPRQSPSDPTGSPPSSRREQPPRQASNKADETVEAAASAAELPSSIRPAIVIPVVRKRGALADSTAQSDKDVVQAANAQGAASSSEKSATSGELVAVPRESEQATQLPEARPAATEAPAPVPPFKKNPLR